MAITISDTEPRVQYTATSGQTSFSVPFEFFANADLVVIKTANNVDTILTYNSSPSSAAQYSVSGAGQSGGGSISLGGSGSTLNDKITIYRNLAIARSTDFPTSGAFQVDSLNTELDKIIAMIQQNERDLKFSPKAAGSTSTAYNLTFPELVANKVLTVNSAGNGLVFSSDIGSYEGNWATATGYNLRDLVKQSSGSDATTLNNIYICTTAHTSTGSYLTQNDSSNWTLIINVVDVATSAAAAAASAAAAQSSEDDAAADLVLTNADVVLTHADVVLTGADVISSAASAAAAAASANAFNDVYLGSKASDPTLDNDGDPLTAGDLYFNTTNNILRVYSGSAWQDAAISSIGVVTLTGTQTLTNKTLTSPKINEAVEVTATATELNYSDIVTLGTTAPSKVFTADANNLTIVSGAVVNVEDILTDGATITWDVIDSPVAKVTLGGNRTLSAPSGTTPFAGQFVSLLIIQDGTGGRTVTWNAVYEFAADTAPTLTATASLGDLFTFRYNGAKWLEVGRNLALTLS
jgi:hypothetical protein